MVGEEWWRRSGGRNKTPFLLCPNGGRGRRTSENDMVGVRGGRRRRGVEEMSRFGGRYVWNGAVWMKEGGRGNRRRWRCERKRRKRKTVMWRGMEGEGMEKW